MAESTTPANKAKTDATSSQGAVEEPAASARPALSPTQLKQVRRARRTERARRTGPFVKYVGSASHRVISPTDWRSLGFTPPGADKAKKGEPAPDFDQTVFEPKNDYMIETAKFTDEQLDYLLIDDLQMPAGTHSFLEMDWDENGELVQVTDDDYEDA
jgi:hypothetical protein